jgi:serine phosphatase RsbU (regulator of sigma subunit)
LLPAIPGELQAQVHRHDSLFLGTQGAASRHSPSCASDLALFLRHVANVGNEAKRIKLLQLEFSAPRAARSAASRASLDLVSYQASAVPGEPSGDLSRVIAHQNGKLSIVIGDVSGHGVEAARQTLPTYEFLDSAKFEELATHKGPAETLRYMGNNPPVDGANLSLMHLLYDPAKGDLEYASAGMPPLIIRRKDGRVEVIENPGIYILGFQGVKEYGPDEFVNRHLHLDSGDMLILMSDGFYERQIKASKKSFAQILRAAMSDGRSLIREIPELATASADDVPRLFRTKLERIRYVEEGKTRQIGADDQSLLVLKRK